ncbi:hypothetical protein HYALB_00011202 [Hymenoscyphus albidus]|uniref:Uncharacterized protein n=1 Tax=Hymenoscyphus albidus TaxID=595503 RepID=A0A9N9LND9_9HELO|nr:hypothetical protein HYALB_00011202 [Hymenoscyphus albidus]
MPVTNLRGYQEPKWDVLHLEEEQPPESFDAPPPFASSASFSQSPADLFSRQPATIRYVHLKHCRLHDDESLKACSGRNKRGGVCLNRASGARMAHLMPTCNKHHNQPRMATSCQEVLSCGFTCGAVFDYKHHDFRLCHRHRSPQSCYLLKVPIEVRMTIYEFLIPESFVPARFMGSSLSDRYLTGRKVFRGTNMAILRVNSLIHDEVANHIYGRMTFEIHITRKFLAICNGAIKQNQYGVRKPRPSTSDFHALRDPDYHKNHALQDYQMQLMLLEQQNKKRLMRARQEQDNSIAGSNFNNYSGVTRSQAPSITVPFHYSDVDGPCWIQPIADRYFNMIKSFNIHFEVPGTLGYHQGIGYNEAGSLAEDTSLIIYELNDHVHRLLGRLQQLPTKNLRLEIRIDFDKIYTNIPDAHYDVRLLLEPFNRIGKSANFQTQGVQMGCSGGLEVELYPRNLKPAANGEYGNFIDYMRRWPKEVSRSEPSPECMKISRDYWKMEKLVTGINSQCPNTIIFDQFTGICQEARVAREAVDWERFVEAREAVIKVWSDYTRGQKAFQDGVESEIEDLCGSA